VAVATKGATELKVAIVHDWLTNIGGAERVVESLLKAYPQADIFTSVYNESALPQFKGRVKTSFLQHWPLAKRKHQLFPVLRTLAFESFDFAGYDLVISSSSAEAKGIITPTETLHVSYIHTPVRYYWSNYDQYLKDPGFGALNPVIRLITPYFVRKMRRWDYAAAQRPDVLVANSATVAKRIKKYYKRDSQVVFPPVDIKRFNTNDTKQGDYMLVLSRLVAYKRFDLAVEACSKLGLKLIVAGDGPELKRLRSLAGPSIEFVGKPTDKEVARLFEGCKGFMFPGEEDFGITPVEAMACGKPVIAYGKGGAAETVVNGTTGILFDKQTVGSVAIALEEFGQKQWDSTLIRRRAEEFNEERFIREIHEVVEAKLA
jgi:glycosyltransferase involved in cell wall biosynthesis